MLANVVYKFKCLRDANNIYIGKTIRHLATRVKEHGTSPSNSAVSNHLTSCETCKLNFLCDSFAIMDSGKNDFEVTIKEALHIMVRSFHVVEIVGTTCELVGTSRVCFNHVVPSRACACTYVQRDASRHCNALRNCTFICCDVQY